MIKKALKIIFGVLLLPTAVIAVLNFCKEITSVPMLSAAEAMFLYGVAAYIGIHIFVYKPDFLYVLGHESTHALTTRLFGGRIFDFKVSSRGGSIKTDKANTTIALMPYMVPFYALLVCLVYALAGFFTDRKPLTGYFVFALGMSLSFHLVQTAEYLRLKQADVIKSGYIFSMPLIILVNIAIVSAVLGLIFVEFSFKHVAVETFNQSRDLYSRLWQEIFL